MALTWPIVLAVLCAAMLHASWNAMIKSGGDKAADTALMPVMPFEMRIGERRISMFAVVATFGTAQDITADELRIETLFPADAQTEALFRSAVPDR